MNVILICLEFAATLLYQIADSINIKKRTLLSGMIYYNTILFQKMLVERNTSQLYGFRSNVYIIHPGTTVLLLGPKCYLKPPFKFWTFILIKLFCVSQH